MDMGLKQKMIFLFAALAMTLSACSEGRVSGAVNSESKSPEAGDEPSRPTPGVTPPNLNSCQESILDYGQKGTVAAVTRGLSSDLKMIPNSRFPSVAFVDGGTLSLRFSWFNGSRYITEIIAGEGSASFVKLAYLSTGRPLVVWATAGTTLKAAFRSSPPGQPGTWNAAVIDTSSASRAISVSVNPLDEIAVLQMTNTTTVGRARFLYCPAGCTSPFGFQNMSSGVQIESANIVAAQQATDVAWCRVNANNYYPAVVYGGTNLTRYAVCRQDDLAQCLNESNWTKQTVVAGANVSASLGLDSTTNADIPKVAVFKAGVGVKTYAMGVTPCSSAPASFNELSSTLGGTSAGSSWLKLLKDSSGKFHVIANESTTSLRYYNNVTSTDILNSSWSAAGVIDTVTLAAAHTGGADYSPIDNRIYVSYPQAARGFNLMVASLQDINTTSDKIIPNLQSIDTSGSVQLVAAPQKNLNLRLDSQARPGAVYADFSPGAATGARLKYARRREANPQAAWDIRLIPNTTNPQFPDLAFDDEDRPWISYFDQTTNRFFLTTNSEADGSGSWSLYQFPVFPTASYTLPATNSTAIVMDRRQKPWLPVMIVLDTGNTSQGVKTGRLDPATGLWSSTLILDALGSSDATSLSADADDLGQISVAYLDLTLNRLRYLASADGGVTWSSSQSISAPGQGAGATIRLNPLTHSPTASFYDRPNNKVLLSECDGNALACATKSWLGTEIESSVGTSGLTNSASAPQDQLLSASLSFFADGTPFVTYTRAGTAGGQLITAERTANGYDLSTLKSGVNASLAGNATYNHGVGGWNTSSVISPSGTFESLFIGPGNWLYSKTCGN